MKAVLTIAGSDSSAGAGIQADLKTIAHFGGYGICAVTSIVAEVPGDVRSIQMVDPEILRDQLDVLSENFEISALKTGMLGTAELAGIVADFLEKNPAIPAIIDPVLIASSGQNLSEADTIHIYRERILSHASLSTPNYPEIIALLDSDATEPTDLAAEFVERFGTAVLLKGGHLHENAAAPNEATDLFQSSETVSVFTAPRLDVPDTHGTGCTLSAAITVEIANGLSVTDAIASAKKYVTQAMQEAYEFGTVRALNHRPRT